MWRTRQVQRLLYELYAYYAIFIGATSYRYDYSRKRYTNTKWTQLIASVANFCVLLIVSMHLSVAWSRISVMDEATEFAIHLDTTISYVICLLRVVQRVPRERATSRIAEELRRMRHIYRYSWSLQAVDELHLQRIYLARNCVMWVLTSLLAIFLLAVYEFVAMPLLQPWLQRMLIILFMLALNGQDLTMHLYFLLCWRMCRLFKRLNKRLEQLINGNSAVYTLELHHLSWQHWQLSKLMHRLTLVYASTILSYRFSLIVSTAALGYYISVFYTLPKQILGLALYSVYAMDGYIHDLMYEWTTQSHRQTLWLLRQQHELHKPDAQLAKGCNILALQIASFPLKVKVFGLYAGGKASWLSSAVLVFSWIIVLLQYRLVAQHKT